MKPLILSRTKIQKIQQCLGKFFVSIALHLEYIFFSSPTFEPVLEIRISKRNQNPFFSPSTVQTGIVYPIFWLLFFFMTQFSEHSDRDIRYNLMRFCSFSLTKYSLFICFFFHLFSATNRIIWVIFLSMPYH